MVSEPQVDGSERLDYIEGMRGVAVTVVMVFHAGIWAGIGNRPAELLGFGQRGVDLFFVISGFCMAWPLISRDGVRRRDPVAFLRRRWRRIAPPYLVAVVLCVLVSAVMYLADGSSWFAGQEMQFTFGADAPNLAGNLLTHGTFTHGFFQDYDRGIDGAFWSLATEWEFYLLLPLITVLARQLGIVAAVLAASSVSGAYVVVVHLADPGFITTAVGYDNIVYRLVEFAAGIGCAASLRGVVRAPRSDLLAAAGLVVMAYFHTRGPYLLGPFAYAAGFTALLLAGSRKGSLSNRTFEARPVRFMGQISYSAYLIHGTVYMLIAVPFTVVDTPVAVRQVVVFVLGPILAIAAARVLCRVVEIRATRWSHQVAVRPVLAQ